MVVDSVLETVGTEEDMSPLLKWPGGKRALLPQIYPFIPMTFNTYFEPFAGGAALFFGLGPREAYLWDKNADLINCYTQVARRPDDLVSLLSTWENSKAQYYEVRALKSDDELVRAARMIYLTTLSFNGLHRVNTRGDFNVPYGNKNWIVVADKERIRRCSMRLRHAHLSTCDFEAVLEYAKKGDFVYFDPPYTVAHGANGFIKYNDKIFTWSDQVRLRNTALELRNRGVAFVISNADHISIRDLYDDFEISTIFRHSKIAANSLHRRLVSELLIR